MNDSEKELISVHTLNWVQNFIINLNICPFAKHALPKLAIDVSDAANQQNALTALIAAVKHLDNDQKIETTLVVFPLILQDFFHYLDFLELAEQFIIDHNYEGIYQLATFHPHYCFANADFEELSNYTNRSPYPMIHILRESSIDKALEFYGDTEQIPYNNIKKMQNLGINQILKIISP